MKSVERSRDFRGPFRSKQWRALIARFPLPTLEETVETHFPTWASFDDNPVSICSTCVKKKEKEREKEKRKFVTTLRQLYIYIYSNKNKLRWREFTREESGNARRPRSHFPPRFALGGQNSRRITVERVSSRGRGIAFRVPRKPRWIHFVRHALPFPRFTPRGKRSAFRSLLTRQSSPPLRLPWQTSRTTTRNAFSNNELGQKRRQIDRSSTPPRLGSRSCHSGGF